MTRTPFAIVERRARRLYSKSIEEGRSPPKDWQKLSQHDREFWRTRALASLRGVESVLDELARESRKAIKEATA